MRIDKSEIDDCLCGQTGEDDILSSEIDDCLCGQTGEDDALSYLIWAAPRIRAWRSFGICLFSRFEIGLSSHRAVFCSVIGTLLFSDAGLKQDAY
jgi:hypothetical protein